MFAFSLNINNYISVTDRICLESLIEKTDISFKF